MQKLKIILFFTVIGILLALAVRAAGLPTYPTYIKDEFKITTDFLTQAGYTNVQTKIVSQSDAYYPNYYFTVDAIPGEVALEWNQTNNGDTVAIFVRRMPVDWVFNNGQMQVDNVYAKTQVRASKLGLYFSVIGPDQAKVIALLNLLAPQYRVLLINK